MRDESQPLRISIPWNKNTAKGFIASLIILFTIILISPMVKIEKPSVYKYKVNTVPLELINFGVGDGTGISKGNLSDEGNAHKGKDPMSNLHDAEVATKTKLKPNTKNIDPEDASNFIAKNEISSNQKTNKNDRGTSSRDIGTKNGLDDGTGLGDKGLGKGLGPGIGPIDWGGGGNRTVLYKKLPSYPKGVNLSAQIKIKFTVSKDGTVIRMVPLQKGDPALERAAMDALKRWRFNPLKENKTMYGIITFTFKLS